MIVTVFRNRLADDEESQREYATEIARIGELAASMPGYVSHKTYTADDGERCTIVEFADAESQAGWQRQPEHAAAQARGRDAYYSHYRIQVCEQIRESSWPRPSDPAVVDSDQA